MKSQIFQMNELFTLEYFYDNQGCKLLRSFFFFTFFVKIHQ